MKRSAMRSQLFSATYAQVNRWYIDGKITLHERRVFVVWNNLSVARRARYLPLWERFTGLHAPTSMSKI